VAEAVRGAIVGFTRCVARELLAAPPFARGVSFAFIAESIERRPAPWVARYRPIRTRQADGKVPRKPRKRSTIAIATTKLIAQRIPAQRVKSPSTMPQPARNCV